MAGLNKELVIDHVARLADSQRKWQLNARVESSDTDDSCFFERRKGRGVSVLDLVPDKQRSKLGVALRRFPPERYTERFLSETDDDDVDYNYDDDDEERVIVDRSSMYRGRRGSGNSSRRNNASFKIRQAFSSTTTIQNKVVSRVQDRFRDDLMSIREHVIVIDRQSFSELNVQAFLGDCIKFALVSDENVSMDADFTVTGKSKTASLCFSTVLQQRKAKDVFVFYPDSEGEITVACSIDSKVHCHVVIKPYNMRGDGKDESADDSIGGIDSIYPPSVASLQSESAVSVYFSNPMMLRQSSLPAANKAPLVWQTRDALIGVGVSVMKTKAKTPTGDRRSTQQSAVSDITNASAAMALDAAADDKHVERGSRISNTQSPPPSPLSPLYSWHSPSHSHSHSQSSAYDSDDISFTSENYLSDRERGKKIKKIPKSSRSVQHPSRGRVRNTPGGVGGSGLYAASASGQDGALSVASSGTQGEESSAVQGSGRAEGYQVGGLSEQQSSSLQPPVTLRVYLEEFRFRPSSIEVRAGTVVEFISDVSVRGERHELECSQEFSSVCLDGASPTYRHAFLRGGHRRVQNQIYTFMTCCITVTESTAAPAVSPQDQYPTLRCPTSTSSSSCIPAAGSAAGSRLGTVPQYTAYNPILGRADRRFRAPKLHGSFPSGTKHCGSLQSVTNTTYRDHFERNNVTSSAALDPEPALESGSGVSVVLPVDYIPPVGDHSAKSMSMSSFYPPLPASRMRPPTSSSSSSSAAYVLLHGISGEDLMRVPPPAVKNGASHLSTSHLLSHADSSPIESVNGLLPPQEAEAERNASGKRSPTFTSPSVPTYSTITTTTVSTSTSPCVPHTIPETHKKSPYLIRSNDFVIGSISKSVQDLILAELCGELLDIRTQDPSLGGQGADVPSLVSVPVGSQCSPSRLVGSFGLTTTSQRSAVAPTDETKSGAVATHSVRKNANSDVTADASTGDSVFSQAASSEMSQECAIAEKRTCSASLSGKEYDASIKTPLLSDRKAEGLDGDEEGGSDCPDESSRKQRRNKKKNQKKNLKKKSKPLDSSVSEEFVDLERGSAYTDMTSACHPHTDILCGDVEIEVVSVTACLLNPVMEDRMYARDQLDVEHSKSKSYSSDAGGLDKQAPVVGNGEEGEKQEEGEGGSEGESHAAPVSAIADMIKSTHVELQCVDEDNGQSLVSDATTALIQSVQPKVPPKRKKRKKPSNAAAQIKMEIEMHTSVKESALSLISYPSFSQLSSLSSSLSSTTASVLSCPSFPSISPSALPAHDLSLLPATLPPPLYECESELGSKIPYEMDDKTKKLVEEECDVKDRIADPPSQVQSQATNLTDLLRTQLGLKPASGKGAGFMRKDEKSVSSVSLPTVTAAKAASRDMKEEEVNCKNEEGKTEELRQRAIEDYLSKRMDLIEAKIMANSTDLLPRGKIVPIISIGHSGRDLSQKTKNSKRAII